MSKDTEIITTGSDVPAIADDDIVAVAEAAEKRVNAVKKIITMALKVTSENDWVDQNGKPYLQGNGAESVANLFGCSWRFIEKPLRVNEEDGHFKYECLLEVSFRGRTVEVMGARSTKDTFFSTRYKYNPDTKQKEPYQLPPSEIDSSDVMKSSITNAIGNGVTRILGIRNATWEMLAEAGLNIEKIRKERGVRYTQTEESTETKDLREEIRRMIKDMSAGDDNEARKMLERFTSFVPAGKSEADRVKGKTEIKYLTEKQIQPTYGKIKLEYEIWQKKQGFKYEDVVIAIQNAATVEEADNLLSEAVKCGAKGEPYTAIVRARDKKATELKEAQK